MRCLIKLALIISSGLLAQQLIDRLTPYSPDWNIVLPPITEEEVAAGLIAVHRNRQEELYASVAMSEGDLANHHHDLAAATQWPQDGDPPQ